MLCWFAGLFDQQYPQSKLSRYLLLQSEQCKNENYVWNLFKVINKDYRKEPRLRETKSKS